MDRNGKTRIVVRVFIDGALKVEDGLELHPLEFDALLPELAERHRKVGRGRKRATLCHD